MLVMPDNAGRLAGIELWHDKNLKIPFESTLLWQGELPDSQK